MSRVGKKPVEIPEGVAVEIEGTRLKVKGSLGELVKEFPKRIKLKRKDNQILVERTSESNYDRALHGTVRASVFNMVNGVSSGFKKEVEIVGVGYRAQKKGENLELKVGYSHPVLISVPKEVDLQVPAPTKIVVTGKDKRLVGEIAAQVRAIQKPEPYKGKGLRYVHEYVRHKVGKTAK